MCFCSDLLFWFVSHVAGRWRILAKMGQRSRFLFLRGKRARNAVGWALAEQDRLLAREQVLDGGPQPSPRTRLPIARVLA